MENWKDDATNNRFLVTKQTCIHIDITQNQIDKTSGELAAISHAEKLRLPRFVVGLHESEGVKNWLWRAGPGKAQGA